MELTILTGPLEGHGGEETVLKEFISSLRGNYSFRLLVSEQIGNNVSWVDDIKSDLAQCKINKNTDRFVKLKFILGNLRRSKDTAVICLTPRMIFLANLAKKMFNKKYLIISWMHFSIEKKFSQSTAKQLLKADYHFAISSGIENELLSLGIPENKIALIYNPVLRQKETIPPASNETKFICVTRIQFEGQKNLSELFQALGSIDSTHRWSLDIYGADDSEGEQEKTKSIELIKQLNIEKHIHWCGWHDNVWSSITSADCLLMSSKYEGFGMVLAEAISRGVPVISSDCPVGPADIVGDSNGFLYQMGDIKFFASCLNKFVEKECHFDPIEVKNSISKMYLDTYKENVEKILSDWVDKDE